MPGGRLTQQDRGHIARGLAEGLGYAEIARRLGRPTSTVSREVSRNGGPEGYRADRAQRAAVRRARRRTAAPARPSAAPPRAHGRDPAAVRAFEDRFTGMLMLSGMTRMTARVLTCLISSDTGSRTAAEIARELGVSPASVSLAVGFLEEQTFLRRERDGQGRRDRYVIDDDIWYRSTIASLEANHLVAAAAREGAEALGPDTPAGTRLAATSAFLDLVGEELRRAADRWREVFPGRPAEP
jgi:DNA-directed RNA polymerase specialized sigma24 family protein